MASSSAAAAYYSLQDNKRKSQDSLGSVSDSCSSEETQQFRKEQRWLLFVCHARRCASPQGKCLEANCVTAQKLCRHIDGCTEPRCSYSRCVQTKTLLNHHKNCKNPSCLCCVPVKNFCTRERLKLSPNLHFDAGLVASDASYVTTDLISRTRQADTQFSDVQPSLKFKERLSFPQFSDVRAPLKCMKVEETISRTRPSSEDLPRPIKRIKIKPPSQPLVTQKPFPSSSELNVNHEPHQKMPHVYEMECSVTSGQASHNFAALIPNEAASFAKQDSIKLSTESDQPKQDSKTSSAEKAAENPKIKGASLMEFFTPEQVKEHIAGLRQWVGQSSAKVKGNQETALEQLDTDNCCWLCEVEQLPFQPPPIYCRACSSPIKKNAVYYTVGSGAQRHIFCTSCNSGSRGDTLIVDGNPIAKAKLEKKENDEPEELWVQCDKCDSWQHQICALFNGRRNEGGQAEYTCPKCYILDVERGVRVPLSQSALLGAKDLPRTILSDHLEKRLFRKLKMERQERAWRKGKRNDEVLGAELITIRVVSSVDKKLDVNLRFLKIFQEKNYPAEFPYKSKVVLVFQKIQGVDVCLFGMYVQEYGSECQFPNERSVYLSYLDSVKYFTPEIKAMTGEALRTFVYHEILIGYLEYCKKRGFTSCYIWACPPMKGEDYILYCHPEYQKTPPSQKLREWYLSMLRKATKEKIVSGVTNLYDHFFVSTHECKAKVTASRLPYFDGDYWPGAAGDIINQLSWEDREKEYKKGSTAKTMSKWPLRSSGQSDLSGNATKDRLLMHKLGDNIWRMKKDFIVVHLQHSCSHCRRLMVSGKRWVCNQCKNFQLCDKCYDTEQKLIYRERHPIDMREKHKLSPVEIKDVPEDTKDEDANIESEFFDIRHAFLSLCQGNNYQYDTLRRAKHSSMMVLYHLHNPTTPFKLKIQKLHDVVIHSSICRMRCCQYPNCRKLKRLLHHGAQCKMRASGGCDQCKIMWSILGVHARGCKESKCSVPLCKELKEQARCLQQQSDSRRRAAVMEMMKQQAEGQ